MPCRHFVHVENVLKRPSLFEVLLLIVSLLHELLGGGGKIVPRTSQVLDNRDKWDSNKQPAELTGDFSDYGFPLRNYKTRFRQELPGYYKNVQM